MGAWRRSWPLLLVLGHAAATESSSGSSFTPGAICSDVDSNALAQDYLRGKHLIINELAWSPYASQQASAPKGWVGMNIEMYDIIAEVARAPPPFPPQRVTFWPQGE